MKTGIVAAVCGLVVACIAALLLGIPAADAVQIIAMSFAVACAVWLVGEFGIRHLIGPVVSPDTSVRMSAIVVAITPAVSLGVGALAASNAMFVSSHDLSVLIVVILGAGAVGVAATMRLVDELEDRRRRIVASHERQAVLEESRREFVAWVSHDLRTPLAGISVLTEALTDGVVDDPETIASYHGRIHSEVERVSRLVDDLFELSRLQVEHARPQTELASMADLVSDAVASAGPAAASRGIDIIGNAEPALPSVHVASRDMMRVVQNLLDNAIHHTPDGGRIDVRVAAHADELWVTVRDQCGGIPPGDIDRVFDVAFRGDDARSPHRGGGGFGLAIARGILEGHGGSIDVENVGGGCCFTVRIGVDGSAREHH